MLPKAKGEKKCRYCSSMSYLLKIELFVFSLLLWILCIQWSDGLATNNKIRLWINEKLSDNWKYKRSNINAAFCFYDIKYRLCYDTTIFWSKQKKVPRFLAVHCLQRKNGDGVMVIEFGTIRYFMQVAHNLSYLKLCHKWKITQYTKGLPFLEYREICYNLLSIGIF